MMKEKNIVKSGYRKTEKTEMAIQNVYF